MDLKLMAELSGIILGDGNLHKKSNCITITGSLEDIYYYKSFVIPLFQDLFSMKPKLRKRNDRNSYYLQLENKQVFEILFSFGLNRGDKTKNACIPKFVLNNILLMPYFLRGIFDTDGCLKFSKQSKHINYYPRIQIALKDSKLSRKLAFIFDSLGFNYSKYKDKRELLNYQLSGKENLERWMDKIGSKNIVHMSKYLFWKNNGFYTPKSTLKQRLKALDLNTELFPL